MYMFASQVHWRSGLSGGDGKVGGELQLLKLSTGEDGKLLMDFKTKASFRGEEELVILIEQRTYLYFMFSRNYYNW